MTVLAPFLRQVERHPDRAAIIAADGWTTSFAALDRWARNLAAAYQRAGVAKHARVLVAVPMTPALYAVLIALWRLGAVAVFPEPAAGLAGLAHAARTTRPVAHVGPSWLGPLCHLAPGLTSIGRRLPSTAAEAGGDAVAAVTIDHPALITFTSGSTGRPKGILRSHGFLTAQLDALMPLLTGDDDDVDMVSLPMFVLANLGQGIPSVIPDGPLRRPAGMDAARLRQQMTTHRVSRLLAPPSVCARLAEDGAPLPLRWIGTGGGPVFPNLLRRMGTAAPEAEIVCIYGSTEAEPIAHVAISTLNAADWRSIERGGGLPAGRPVPQIRLRLENDEIIVTGDLVNKGYLDPSDDPRSKRRVEGDIWHATGDAGRLDADGRLWLLGRLDGRVGNLFPFAVETAALAWPGVEQAALIGLGGRPTLAVAGQADHGSLWRDLARAAFPDVDVRVIDRIPLDRRHNAKIDYPTLRRRLQH